MRAMLVLGLVLFCACEGGAEPPGQKTPPTESVLVARCRTVGTAFCTAVAPCRPSTIVENCTELWVLAHCSYLHAPPDLSEDDTRTCSAAWSAQDCYADIIAEGWNESTAPVCPAFVAPRPVSGDGSCAGAVTWCYGADMIVVACGDPARRIRDGCAH